MADIVGAVGKTVPAFEVSVNKSLLFSSVLSDDWEKFWEVTYTTAVCENLVKGHLTLTKKKEKGDIITGSHTLRANAPSGL